MSTVYVRIFLSRFAGPAKMTFGSVQVMDGKQPGSVLSHTGRYFLLLLSDGRPYGFPVPYRKFQERFANILASHGGRPHWAKQHALKPKDIEALYPKFADYRSVIERVDPAGTFRSEYVRRHLDGENISDRCFKRRQ